MAEVVVHRLRPADLALAGSIGLEPETLTVAADGLMLGFATAARPRPAP